MYRITHKTVKEYFKHLIEYKVIPENWILNYNPTYGGFRLEEGKKKLTNRGVEYIEVGVDVFNSRYKPREFYNMLRAIDRVAGTLKYIHHDYNHEKCVEELNEVWRNEPYAESPRRIKVWRDKGLTQFEKDRLRYLEHHEPHPKGKGGLSENEGVELFNLRKKRDEGL